VLCPQAYFSICLQGYSDAYCCHTQKWKKCHIVISAIAYAESAPHGVTITTIMEDYPINDIPPGEYDVQFRLTNSESAEKSLGSDGDYTYLLQFMFRPWEKSAF